MDGPGGWKQVNFWGGNLSTQKFLSSSFFFFPRSLLSQLLYGLSTSPCHLPEKLNSPSNRKTGATLIFIIFYSSALHVDTFTL